MKRNIFILLLVFILFSFSACGGGSDDEIFDETTVSINKDGEIKEVIVESFDKDYYSEEGLNAFFQEKISDYNSTNIGGGNVKLEELIVENGKAKATLTFDSADTYKAFNGASIFFGTVSEAYDKGYITETVLKENGSSSTITKIELMNELKDNNIIIVSEIVRVKCPSKITYTSANVEVIDDKNARISSESSGLAYILLK